MILGLRRVLGDDFKTSSHKGEGDCTAPRVDAQRVTHTVRDADS